MKKLFTSTRLLLFTILLGSTFFNASGQTSETIDFRLYTTKAHPYMIPVVVSGSDFYLSIITGHPVYISVTNTDKGTGNFYKATSPTKTLNGDTILIDAGDVGNWLVTYSSGGTLKSIKLHTTYQADLQDQTIGSATYGDYPDFIWVAQGGSAVVSAGKYMANYRWKYLDNSNFQYTGGGAQYTDSVKTLGINTYFARVSDATGNISQDTISILEKPTFNSTAKTLNFPTTTTGITYKLLKAGSISGTDTTWTETQNFVGDGNAKNITLTEGKYKLTTTFGIHTAVYPYGYFVVGVTTALDKTKEENINYRLVDNKLQFDNEVNFKFYSLQGQLLQQEQGSSFKLCRQEGIFKATDRNGNVLTAKIILK
jgi:hypothetical protein